MTARRLAVYVASIGVALAGGAAAATLTIHVQNVSKKGGILSLAVYARANYHDDDHPTVSRDVDAVSPVTTVRIRGLKPGRYAVKTFQDINRNGKFDQDLLGLPEEPYGFSNNAEPELSEPDFSATAFPVGPAGADISIRLSDTDSVSPPVKSAHRDAGEDGG